MLYIQKDFLLSLHYHGKLRPKLYWAEMSILAGSFPSGMVVKNLPANAEDVLLEIQVLSLGWKDPGNGNPLQYSCLENPMDREVWWATAHGVAKTWTQLSD